MELKDMKFAGSGTVGAGEYANISCSGSAKILGDVKCKSFSVAGSAKAEGDIWCEDHCKASGSFKTEGKLVANTLSCAGSVKVCKDVQATSLKMAGAVSLGGDCTAETVKLAGAVNVNGLLNAETVEIRLSGKSGNSNIGSIGGGQVKVERGTSNGLFGFHKKCKATLTTPLIEADRVELENTIAKTVRVMDAVIGDGCRIDLLEYSGTITVSDKATVEQTVKI